MNKSTSTTTTSSSVCKHEAAFVAPRSSALIPPQSLAARSGARVSVSTSKSEMVPPVPQTQLRMRKVISTPCVSSSFSDGTDTITASKSADSGAQAQAQMPPPESSPKHVYLTDSPGKHHASPFNFMEPSPTLQTVRELYGSLKIHLLEFVFSISFAQDAGISNFSSLEPFLFICYYTGGNNSVAKFSQNW